MPGRKAPPPLGLGVYLPPPPAAVAAEDPIDEELRKAVRRVGGAAALARIAGGADPAAAVHPSTPPPATLTEAVSAASSLVNIHKGAADTALAIADAERERRIEAEGGVGEAVQAAVQRERTAAEKALELVREVYQGKEGMLKEIADLRVGVEQSKAEKIATDMKASIDAALAEMKGQVKARDDKIAELQTENATLKQRETYEERVGRAVVTAVQTGNFNLPELRGIMPPPAPPAPTGKPIDQQWAETIMPKAAEEWQKDKQAERDVKASEARRNDSLGNAALQIAQVLRTGGLHVPFGGMPSIEQLDQQPPG